MDDPPCVEPRASSDKILYMSKQPGRNPGRARRVFLAESGEGPWQCYARDGDVQQIGRRTRDGNIHHLDGDVANDVPTNLVMMHADCHQHLHGPPTPDQRRQISEKLKGRRSPTRGMKFTEESNRRKSQPGAQNGFYGKTHSQEALEKMRTPRDRVTCTDCGQVWSVNWVKRHKRDGRCLRAASIVISGVRRTPGKLPKTTCVDCGKPYASRWMERHKREGKCIVPSM